MSERERWIVYPLLFMALGVALHDKLAGGAYIKRIVCRELNVVGADNRTLVEISANGSGGYVSTVRADQKMRVMLGHRNNISSVFVMNTTDDGQISATPALGDLQRIIPSAGGSQPALLRYPWLSPDLARPRHAPAQPAPKDKSDTPAPAHSAPEKAAADGISQKPASAEAQPK